MTHRVQDNRLEIHAIVLPPLDVDPHDARRTAASRTSFRRRGACQRDFVHALCHVDRVERFVVDRDAERDQRRRGVRAEVKG